MLSHRPSASLKLILRKDAFKTASALLSRLLHQSIRRHGEFAGGKPVVRIDRFLTAFVLVVHYATLDKEVLQRSLRAISVFRQLTELVEKMVLSAPNLPPQSTQHFQPILHNFFQCYESWARIFKAELMDDALLEIWSLLSRPAHLKPETLDRLTKYVPTLELQYVSMAGFHRFEAFRNGFLSGERVLTAPILTLPNTAIHRLRHELLYNPHFLFDKEQPDLRLGHVLQQYLIPTAPASFWAPLEQDLQARPMPELGLLMALLTDLQTALIQELTGAMKQRVQEELDMPFIQERIQNNAFTWVDFNLKLRFLVNTVSPFCLASEELPYKQMLSFEQPSSTPVHVFLSVLLFVVRTVFDKHVMALNHSIRCRGPDMLLTVVEDEDAEFASLLSLGRMSFCRAAVCALYICISILCKH